MTCNGEGGAKVAGNTTQDPAVVLELGSQHPAENDNIGGVDIRDGPVDDICEGDDVPNERGGTHHEQGDQGYYEEAHPHAPTGVLHPISAMAPTLRLYQQLELVGPQRSHESPGVVVEIEDDEARDDLDHAQQAVPGS
eukprot:CAMPEP_0176021134 /NCGR_PEP_ID=MMETSP0120_2-20121206/10255_1 /TAXON_ID=160619 /ORGANISM="Kryptoperidinium foliaceum, Strain CCMP 1326" /LENGTH=137 /DNA_ID=CAMNT_0017354243 /DNA_START=17 /DNA_END=430 /DNA_ORIENTATION=+